MAEDNEPLEQIASAVLDGTAVDWEAVESSVAGADRPLLPHLKAVAALAAVHRLPATWGHLQVMERIGTGAFGEIYRAFDPRLDREVALKLQPAARRADGGATPSFIPEGRLLAETAKKCAEGDPLATCAAGATAATAIHVAQRPIGRHVESVLQRGQDPDG